MDKRFAAVDYFQVLEIHPAAKDADIKAAFRRLALLHHPDKANYDKEEAKGRFQLITEAYEVLIDPELRDQYSHVRQREEDLRAKPAGGHGRSFGGVVRPAPRKSGSSSLAAERRAAVEAEMQKDLNRWSAGWKDSSFVQSQKSEQAQFDAMKRRLSQEVEKSGGEWENWSKKVRDKWLDQAWEEHLPGVSLSAGMRDLVIRDVRRESRAALKAKAAAGYDTEEPPQANAAEEKTLPQRELNADGGPMPKRKATRQPSVSAEPEERPPLPAAAAEYLERQRRSGRVPKRMGYLEMIKTLSGLGFSTNLAELAARDHSTAEEAIEWIASQERR